MRFPIWMVFVPLAAFGCARPPRSPAEQAEAMRLRADELHARAVRLQGQPGKAEKAARLHRESARLRPPSDPRAFDCYAQAGEVLLAAGKGEQARALMEESAEFALRRGDSVNAARSYALAVLMASRQRTPRRVVALAARMQAVARSPTMPKEEHDQLTTQIARALAEAEAAIQATARSGRAQRGESQ